MSKIWLLFLIPIITLLMGCPSSSKVITETVDLPPVVVDATDNVSEKKLKTTYERKHDLLHTKLDVSFDWANERLNGEAYLTLKPYFYPSNLLRLDAKGFDLHEVSLVKGNSKSSLKYDYSNLKDLYITLDKVYSMDDAYTLYIKYTAKPSELPAGDGFAIRDRKGLYFINSDGSDPKKPQQIWTQGEPESSSCWFPTIDRPNENTTQELTMTVQDKFVTLSNGLLMSRKKNNDGTRTDYWKMDLPHAPYLFMMAVGEFQITKDTWKNSKGENIEISYYLEDKYHPYARDIFGNTIEMLDLFNKLFDYEYPWSKYSQVVVRDFVSGAMENTTGVIHYAGVQKTKSELLDGDSDGIIAHELIHHWFGNLVTCEEWGQIPLNEAFANYGEYLWREHKHGMDWALYHNLVEAEGYLNVSRRGAKKSLIRYNYDKIDDMFDANSYNKGGRIMNMMRNFLGDDAFFKGISNYLHKHEYSAVEVHDLRLALEETSGRDLNWFFDQWWFTPGHPVLDIKYDYLPEKKMAQIIVEQKQDVEVSTIYTMPVKIDVYANNTVTTHNVVASGLVDTILIEAATKPDLINFDADKLLLCEKTENKTVEEMAFQYRNGKNFIDRYEAMELCIEKQATNQLAKDIMIEALNDDFWALRRGATREIDIKQSEENKVKPILIALASDDTRATVRSAAVNKLSEFKDASLLGLFDKSLKDPSNLVAASGLNGLNEIDTKKAFAKAAELENSSSNRLLTTISKIYSKGENSTVAQQAFFENKVDDVGGFSKYSFIKNYGIFLEKINDTSATEKALPTLQKYGTTGSFWIKHASKKALESLAEFHEKNEDAELATKINAMLVELGAGEE